MTEKNVIFAGDFDIFITNNSFTTPKYNSNMINKDLLKVSLRCGAVYIPSATINEVSSSHITRGTVSLLMELRKIGFSLTEPLLHVFNGIDYSEARIVLDTLNEIMGSNLNWAPLIKGWNDKVAHSWMDVKFAEVFNLLGYKKGTRLRCGHVIPEGVFDIKRYNGCPLCGTPKVIAPGEIFSDQGSKLKPLSLWSDTELMQHFNDLLTSSVSLDATQVESLNTMLRELPLPAGASVKMKETLMLVLDTLIEAGKDDEAQQLIKSPVDVMRYLWFKHTGYLQIVPPRVLIAHAAAAGYDHRPGMSRHNEFEQAKREELKLKFDRATCHRVAKWMNALPMDVRKACEEMHPRREMWVRFIRALRLPEYAKRRGFDYLRNLLDVFYRQDYAVLQGWIEEYKLRYDLEGTLSTLKQYPGRFARCLFSTMLWFDNPRVLNAFKEVVPQLPTRLLITLGMYAEFYFDPNRERRTVKTVLGEGVNIPVNTRIFWQSANSLRDMIRDVKNIYYDALFDRYAAKPHNEGDTIYIAPELYHTPINIGDRAMTVQDVNAVPQGTVFDLEGDKLRVFMQWGKGLPAQPLDMDLSCVVAYNNHVEHCAYFSLNIPGADHSGDIRSIPHQVGTAEYIELDLTRLQMMGAKYVTFTCNAYSNGNLSPNLVVGWMDSKYPMQVSNESGVAYDPSCVQHQVRITKDCAKGLVFGVLNVINRTMTWLETSFEGQTLEGLNIKVINDLMAKLEAKLTIGKLLDLKAHAQGLRQVDNPAEANEAYTRQWAQDQAAVAKLLVE